MSRILIVTDAWAPQINGVVRTLEYTCAELKHMGHEVAVFAPDLKRWCTVPLPSYPEIKLEFFAGARMKDVMNTFRPDYIHIATEGPLGWTARRICMAYNKPFSTAFHTNFPDYVAKRLPPLLNILGRWLATKLVQAFHDLSYSVMVPTASIAKMLERMGIENVMLWPRGVDCTQFKPGDKNLPAYQALARPVLLYVGRVAVEKNLDDFLKLDLPGTKVVVGDGPDMALLRKRYPAAKFMGTKTGDELARYYAAADCFVFPSKTETFGLVLLEALACGLPVAACPAPGPQDIFLEPVPFVRVDNDLARSVHDLVAAKINPADAHLYALRRFSWAVCTDQFMQNIVNK